MSSCRPAPAFSSLILSFAALLAVAPATLVGAAEPNPAAERAARQADLDALNRKIELSTERSAALQREIDGLAKDRASLNDALVAAGDRERSASGQLAQTEVRIRILEDRLAALRASLNSRRAALGEILAGLQRLGRAPPPALLVRPEDALDSLRSAILLGAVVPSLKVDADALLIDLNALKAVRTDLAREQALLVGAATAVAEERRRIELLIAEKRKAEATSLASLQAEREIAARLATEAISLKELLTGLEKSAVGRPAPDTARPAPAPASRTGPRVAALGPADRIAPAVAFASAKGLLPRPVGGTQLRGFGEDDGLGGKSLGATFTTRNGARVSAPADGWVAFVGPFRSYGELLIINVGGGYHVLLAGMERSDVELGQFVLAGEPVAVMGDRRVASAGAVEIGQAQPQLYVEFRKDGVAIDPGPWWARTNDEKVGG